MSMYVVLLAAGASRRFGATPKQAALWQQQPILTQMATRAEALAPGRTRVVLGAYAQQLLPLVTHSHALIHPQWSDGLGSSIAFGVAALPADASCVLLLLADQLAVTEQALAHLQHVHAGRSGAAITCAFYDGVRGVPALFSAHFFPQLRRLQGEQGAKSLLRRDETVSVPLPAAAIDIDTQTDLLQFEIHREIDRANIDY